MKPLMFLMDALKKSKINFLGRFTIRRRLMSFFSIIIIVPLLAVGIISYTRFSSYVEKMTVNKKLDMSRSAMEGIGIIKDRDEKISNQIIINKDIQQALLNSNYSDYLAKYRNIKDLDSLLFSMMDNDNVVSVTVLGINGEEYTSNKVGTSTSQNTEVINFLKNPDIEAKNRASIWVTLNRDIFLSPVDIVHQRDKPYHYLVRRINDTNNFRTKIGYLIIQLNYARFNNILRRTSAGEGEYSILIDSDGKILCHTTDVKIIGTKIGNDMLSSIKTAAEGYFYSYEQKGKFLVQFINDKESGWTIIQGIPYTNITEKSREIRDFIILLIAICLIAAIALSLIFSKNITNPIIKLKTVIDNFGEGNLKLRAKKDRLDEIGQLQESFNNMADDIRNLVKKIDEENKTRRMLELSILEYQINPHFLYNTLDSINWMAQKSEHREISEMVTALARFFRIGLSKGKEFIKIKDELEHANNYLIISKMRFKDCFDYKFDTDEAILDCKTIKLILQPIIENAILHGIDKNLKTGLIEIKSYKEGEKIYIQVRDNGKGIDDSTLASIKNALGGLTDLEPNEFGIGLMNVHQRIILNFGSDYGVDIQSSKGQGTIVCLSIPLLT